MTFAEGEDRLPIPVVLPDANVLYSRLLRDYLLYSATQGALEIRWSAEILAEVVEHLTENVAGSRGYRQARRVLLGGVSSRLLKHSRVPVIVVPRE